MIMRTPTVLLFVLPLVTSLFLPNTLIPTVYAIKQNSIEENSSLTIAEIWNHSLFHRPWGHFSSAIAQETTNGNITVAASSTSYLTGTESFALDLATINSTGSLQWNHSVVVENLGWGFGSTIIEGGTKGFLVAGTPEGSPQAIFINPQGAMLWNLTIQTPGLYYISDGCRLANGRFLLAGGFYPPEAHFRELDVWAACITTSGDVLWSVSYGDTDIHEFAEAVVASPLGGALIIGTQEVTNYEMFAMYIDNFGSPLWKRNYENVDTSWGIDVLVCENGEFLLIGERIWTNELLLGVWFVKIDSAGKVVWERIYDWLEIVSAANLSPDSHVFIGYELQTVGNRMWYEPVSLGIGPYGEQLWRLPLTEIIRYPDLESVSTCENGDFLVLGRDYYTDETWVSRVRVQYSPTAPTVQPPKIIPLLRTVWIDWLPSEDPDGEVSKYEVQFCTSANFTDENSTLEVQSLTAIYTDLNDGEYHFRVRAIDNLGSAGSWSDTIMIIMNASLAWNLFWLTIDLIGTVFVISLIMVLKRQFSAQNNSQL
jgi:hypothetical protein